MEEILVAFACLMKAQGCNEAAQAYYQQHPQLEELVRRQERLIDRTVPPMITQYIAPIAVLTVDPTRSLNVRLSNRLSIGYSKDNKTLLYKFDF